jgi:anti-sigma-K factor RskA
MMDHRELLELATNLPMGVLEPAEERELEAHLRAGCAECERALRESAATLDALVRTLPPVTPSPDLRARLLARVQEDRPVARQRGAVAAPRRSWLPYALAASVLVAFALGVQVARQSSMLDEVRAQAARQEQQLALANERAAEHEQRLAAAEQERARLGTEVSTLEGMVADLTAQQTRVVALAGAGPAPAAAGRAYLDPESRRLVLVVYELPPLPPGQSYQLWVISEGEPVSAGVFQLATAGATRYDTTAEAPKLAGPLTIAVTIEPEGGLPKPSGPIVLAGS